MKDHDWIDRAEYPFASHYLDLDMGQMHYLDEGTGAAVVMVHGNPTWSFLYRNLIKQLSAKYRCIAMDHIGFGLSDKPEHWSYLPYDHARNLSTLIETLDLKDITLVVQDWGGPIGLNYAIDNPQNVKGLIILNTWMWSVNDDLYYVTFSKFAGSPIGRFLIERFNLFARAIVPLWFQDKSKLTKTLHQQYLKPLSKPQKRKGSWVFPQQILGETEWLDSLWKRRSLLADIPKLIVWGMKDIAFREQELNKWLDAFPSAEVIKLSLVGHFVQEEAPNELGRAVEQFLSRKQDVSTNLIEG